MAEYNKLSELFRPKQCDVCGGRLTYKYIGVYECEDCKHLIMDEFGKIRTYLEDNPKATMAVVSEYTGIPIHKIEKYLREGRLQIPENSAVFIKCENCNIDIRYGRYCPNCAAELSKKLDGAFKSYEVGEVPKKVIGKMHFLNEDDNNKRRRR